MKRTRLRMAALALGGALALLAPVTAAAQDRNDFHRDQQEHAQVERRDFREHDRDRDRARPNVEFNNNRARVRFDARACN